MKKLFTLLTLLVIATLNGYGQLKQVWIEGGGVMYFDYNSDTTYRSYTLKGKDSVSVTIETDNCQRFQYWIDYDGKKHDVKGLIRKHLASNFWTWVKEETLVKGKVIKTSPAKWVNNSGMSNIYRGVYTKNGKFVQPQYIIDKYGKHEVD